MAKILVERNELESVRELVDSLLEKGGKQSFDGSVEAQTDYGSPYKLDNREKKVVDYISSNSGTTKEDVVRGLKGKYSRVTIFHALDRLLEKDIIVTTHRNEESRINHLYVNHDRETLSTQENLAAFQYFYSELMDEMILIFQSKFPEKEKGKEGKALIYLLSRMVELYKFLCITYITSDILLWEKRPLDNDILHTRFELFLNAMKELHTKLIETLTKVGIGLEKGKEIIYAILFNSEWSLSIGELYSMLKYFKKNGLGDHFEPVVDAIWVLSYHILPSIDPYYGKHYRNGTLIDWRNMFDANSRLQYKPITKQSLVPEEY